MKQFFLGALLCLSIGPLKGSEATQSDTLAGGVFLAADARRRGLVDAVGSRPQAISRAVQLGARHAR